MPRYENGDVNIAKRNARIMEMKAAGHSYRYIGNEIGLSPQGVHNIVTDEIRKMKSPHIEEVRKAEIHTLDALEQVAVRILEKNHIVVQHGKVVRYRDEVTGSETTLEDSAPVMQAIATILKVQERRSKLLGLDSPIRVEAQVTETTQADLELQDLLSAAEAKSRLAEQELTGSEPLSGVAIPDTTS